MNSLSGGTGQKEEEEEEEERLYLRLRTRRGGSQGDRNEVSKSGRVYIN